MPKLIPGNKDIVFYSNNIHSPQFVISVKSQLTDHVEIYQIQR